MQPNNSFWFIRFAGLVLAVTSVTVAATAAAGSPQLQQEQAEQREHEHENNGNHATDRIPTPEGMAIAIVKPEAGAQFEAGKPIRVEVDAKGLDAAGDHWHLYLDGELQAMVGGGRTAYELQTSGVEPGKHELTVTISNSSHEEYDTEHRRVIRIDP